MKHVAHLTSVHPQPDTRILLKECRTLAAAGYDVTLVAPANRDEVVDGVAIRAVRPPGSRLHRMTRAIRDVYRVARSLDADLYHFHDPELLPVGVMLHRQGRSVVYDVHEDVPGDILGKDWIAPRLRSSLSTTYDRLERAAAARLGAVVAAGPDIADRFARLGVPAITVANYPILSELETDGRPWSERELAVCYVGSLTPSRGLFQMIDAAEAAGVKLLLAGTYSEEGRRKVAMARPGWPRVEELARSPRVSHYPRNGVVEVIGERSVESADAFSRARAGLLVVAPEPNHMPMLLRSHKLFDYMAAGLPVIVSDFPVWRSFVEGHGCGICVDPLDPDAIGAAIRRIVDDPDEAERMGARGREAVKRAYTWEGEGDKLLGLYADLLAASPNGSPRP